MTRDETLRWMKKGEEALRQGRNQEARAVAIELCNRLDGARSMRRAGPDDGVRLIDRFAAEWALSILHDARC